MTATVLELCSVGVVTVRAQELAHEALETLRQVGIHGAPVVNGERAVGVITTGDLAGSLDNAYVADRMSTPVVAIDASTSVWDAAQAMTGHCVHHLVVTQRGVVVGFVSALDIIRGLLHPGAQAERRADPAAQSANGGSKPIA